MLLESVLTAPWIETPSDGIASETLTTQLEAEHVISAVLTDHIASGSTPPLQTATHTAFLTRLLKSPLPMHFTGLDASRPWLIYWICHSLALFDGELDTAAKSRIVDTLKKFQNPKGGFGGGPGQLSHLAPTFASVAALCYVGEAGWSAIDRNGLYHFLLSMKQADGSFVMHEGGEVDVRGCYCALSVAALLNLLTPELVEGTADFLASCQTYEGGLASAAHAFPGRSGTSAPLGEAHGGYAFCAAASWSMLRPFSDPTSPCFSPRTSTPRDLDVQALLRWAASVQAMPIEGGGFRGRTNKLVDGCYSWWCGGLFSILTSLLADDGGPLPSKELYDRRALEQYVILAAQAPGGGLRDKPGKPADAYHTCYNLSGLAAAQHHPQDPLVNRQQLARSFTSPFRRPMIEEEAGGSPAMILSTDESEAAAEARMREVWSRELSWTCTDTDREVYGDAESNSLQPTHPIFNISTDRVRLMMAHFYLQS
ncbi:protein farnesyltransferase subunit beta [Sporobolomyces koalae]|uniref:protein farnesyltransferase subunit beta n=1 Tax=Sporobolomyces koalae TaxID=500713 RepID=UPI00317B30B0